MAVGYQSFYQAQLTSPISDTDLTIPLDEAPIPDSGFLVIESTVASKREIIYYTSKTTNSVTCPAGGRGYDGTTAVSHLSGAVVIMAPVGAMFEELREQFATTPAGWTTQVPTVSAVTANGNRSYTLTHASSIASVVSPGMRRRFTRTVAANTYMGGAFNGSSHYFTKTSPSGTLGTVTNNFTIEATYQPTAYQEAIIAARSDSAGNNSIILKMTASGTVMLGVQNGGAGNYRLIPTYQSLPLNKKTTIAATWASGTVTISFDGISVPVQTATAAGTAPTTAGTGGDFSIGRKGASSSEYAPGYISNVAVFDAVLSASTIKQHATYKLTGSETNCIGAWSLDNTANDQSSAGNNLTATGGVGFTNKSPFGNDGVTDNLEYGLTMSVSSDGLTEVVQVPEGCALPTTGGITASAYSSMANPYGWVSDKGRWEVATLIRTTVVNKTSPTSNIWYNVLNITIPTGAWNVKNRHYLIATGGSITYLRSCFTLSTGASSETNTRFTASTLISSPAAGEVDGGIYSEDNIRNTTATVYYLNQLAPLASVTTISFNNASPNGDGITYALPSGL